MTSNSVSRRSDGFTLIELLIVIAIIAILASILFPVFARARENARRASCMSNQKQIGLGILQYSQDYDEKFPLRWVDDPGVVGWVTLVQPYTKSAQIFQCPSEPKRPPASSTSDGYTDYCSNYAMFPNPDPGQTGISLVQLRFASNTISVLEVDDSIPSGSTSAKCSARYNDWADWDPTATKYRVRHLGGANWLFADAHVKWLTTDKISNSTPTASNYTFSF